MIVRKKKWLTVLLTVIFILVLNSAVLAAPSSEMGYTIPRPYWDNTNGITLDISITNGKAVLVAVVNGKTGVTEITAEVILERKKSNGSYSEVDGWDDLSVDGNLFTWSSTRYFDKGYTYRLTINATVYKDGIGEDVSGSRSVNY